MKTSRKKENINAVRAVLFSFLIYMIHICQEIDINISLDEIGTFVSGAALAGRDWSGSLPFTRYYGYGYYWIFAGLFRITNNPYVIYLTILLVNSLILSLTAFLIYKIEIHEFNLPDNFVTVFFAVLPGCVYTIVNYAYLSNDVMVYTSFWIVVYLTLKLFNSLDIKTRKKYSFLLAFFLCYSLTIHEKTIAVFGIILFCLAFWAIFIRKNLVNWKVFSGSILVFYILARATKKLAISLFWSDIIAESLANTSVIYTDVLWFIDEIRKLKITFDIFISNIIKTGMYTYGLFFLAVMIMLSAVIVLIKNKCNIRKILERDTEIEKTVFVFTVSMATILVTMLGIALQWGNGIWNALNEGNPLGVNARAYGYLRYYIIYIGPILISTYFLCLNQKLSKGFYWGTFSLFTGLSYYYLTEIDSYVGDQNKVMEFVTPFDNQIWNRHISVLLLILFIFLLSRISKRHIQLIFVSVCSLLMLIVFLPKNFGLPRLKSNTCGATYEYISTLEKEENWKDNIYFLDNAGCYQFFLNQYTIHMYVDEQYGILFSHRNIDQIYENSLGLYNADIIANSQCIQLDENEYVYILGNILE